MNPTSIVFNAAAKFSNTCLNQYPLRGFLPRFREVQHTISGDNDAWFHQIKFLKEGTDSFRFLSLGNFNSSIEDYLIFAHILDKFDSRYYTNLALKRTAVSNKWEFTLRSTQTSIKYLFMNSSLNSFQNFEETIDVLVAVMELLKSNGFNLSKFVSSNSETVNWKLYPLAINFNKRHSKHKFRCNSYWTTTRSTLEPK